MTHIISKYSNKVICLALLTAVLSSCSNEDYLGGQITNDCEGVQMNLTAKINSDIDPSLSFAAGDSISVSATYGDADASCRNRIYNCQQDGSTFLPKYDSAMYVKGSCDIVGIYPAIGTDQAEPTFTISTSDQSNITNYFFATADSVTRASGSQVHLVFTRALAQLKFNFTVPEGEKITNYCLSGFALSATVNPYTLAFTTDSPTDLTGTGNQLTTLTFSLIPQTILTSSDIPATLTLIGSYRSYNISLGNIILTGGKLTEINVDASTGTATIEYVNGTSQWNSSTAGGNVSSASN